MWDDPRKILVGVEGPDCEAALHVAAHEARVRRCGVHLVHVMPLLDAIDAGSAEDQGDAHGWATRMLGETAVRLERLLDAVPDDGLDGELHEGSPVSTELCRGDAVGMLVEDAPHAELVVLQHRAPAPGPRSHGAAVTAEVADRARAAVLVVPHGWHAELAPEIPLVVAGVDDPLTSAEVVRGALAEADRSEARLEIVHARDEDTAGAGIGSDPRSASTGLGLARRIEEELAPVLTERPDVPVEVEVVDGPVVEALLERARCSSLLVIGRRRVRLTARRRGESVARAALRLSSRPVLVVGGTTIEPAPLHPHGRDRVVLP